MLQEAKQAQFERNLKSMEVTLSKLITCVSALLQEERNIDSTENANSDVARSLHFSETLIQALQVLEDSKCL